MNRLGVTDLSPAEYREYMRERREEIEEEERKGSESRRREAAYRQEAEERGGLNWPL